MPDYIESDGNIAMFASLREPAWHGLGTVFTEEVNTEEMLRIAHLDNWNVRVEEVEVPEGYWAAKPQYRTVRTSPFDHNTTDILGYVGERYHPFQNEELFSFGDALLEGGTWETGGSIKNGTRVFGSLALNRSTTIGDDSVDNYLLVTTSHDGSASIQASVTPVRVVCKNTLNVALRNAKQTFKIRHTQSMQGRVQAARDALGLAEYYIDLWTEEMDALRERTITNMKFDELVSSLYEPKSDSKAAMTRYMKKREVIWDNWVAPQNANVYGTAYGALNALNEELMWNRNGRGENSMENLAVSRSGFNPIWNAENNALFEAVAAI